MRLVQPREVLVDKVRQGFGGIHSGRIGDSRMPGILYVVATPIGNLEDVTLRALRILRDVSLVAAEDTRRTGRLLQHYSISTRTTSLHEHNEREKTPRLVDRLLSGDSIALVSDAGTPVISDPGEALIAAARAAGVRVESVPGPSAVMASLAASGLPSHEFTFLSFPPSRSKDRKKWLARAANEPRLVVFFEAPHRVRATLAELAEVAGDRLVGVARELTKVHEELVIQPISTALTYFSEPRGEFTILLPPQDVSSAPPKTISAGQLASEFCELTKNNPGSRRQAVRALADRHGLRVNEVYRILHEPEVE
ncbi:MAG: 16S rRNA (cytidine(1402)-2'-O)-methyltransferase [Acidobacteria bacterium]|nr:MAG: 16S rRNA (cytidine(1402)-2'-O)-methyltransferase [Acidobacteriota bacterium]